MAGTLWLALRPAPPTPRKAPRTSAASAQRPHRSVPPTATARPVPKPAEAPHRPSAPEPIAASLPPPPPLQSAPPPKTTLDYTPTPLPGDVPPPKRHRWSAAERQSAHHALIANQLPGLHPDQRPVDAVAALAVPEGRMRAAHRPADHHNALRIAHYQAHRRLEALAEDLPATGQRRVRRFRDRLRRHLQDLINAEIDPTAARHIPRLEHAPRKVPGLQRRTVPTHHAVELEAPIDRLSPLDPADQATTFEAPELDQLAAQLATPLAIFRWVHDNVAPEIYRGARNGPLGTLKQRTANDLDAAWLTSELLRRIGIPTRLELGRIVLSPAQARSYTGVRHTARAASVLNAFGIPSEAQAQGNTVTALVTEHWWVNAWLPVSRSTPDDRRWMPLFPMLKPVSVPPAPDIAYPELTDDILYSRTAPLTRWLQRLGEPKLPARAIAPYRATFLTGGMPPLLESTGVVREIPATEHHRLTLRLGSAPPRTLRTADLYNHPLTLESVPATDHDAAIIDAAGGIERTPAFALRLRLELHRDGQPLATTPAARPGDPAQLAVTIHAPDGHRAHAFDLTHGARYSVAVGLGRTQRPSSDDPLHVVGQSYFRELRQSATRIFDLYDIATAQDVHVGLVGHEVEIVRVAGLPARMERRFIVLDMPGLTMAPYARGPDRSREPQALTLLGHQSSYLEGAVPQRFYGGEGWSAQAILAEARRRELPLHRLDLTQHELIRELEPLVAIPREAWEEVADQVIGASGLTMPAELARQLRMQLSLRRTAVVPHAPLPSGFFPELPSLAGFVSFDPATGEGAYLIHPSLNGGFLVTAEFRQPLGTGAVTFSDIASLPRCGARNDWRAGSQAGAIRIKLRRLPAGYCAADRNDHDPNGRLLGTCRHEVVDDHGELTEISGQLCNPSSPPSFEVDRQQCTQSSFRSNFHVLVFLNGRLAWKQYFELEDIFADGEGFAPWKADLPKLHDHRDAAPLDVLRTPGGLGFATGFTMSADGDLFAFDYYFDEDPRLPTFGGFDVYVFPQLGGDALLEEGGDAMCRVARHAQGNYSLLRGFSTAAPTGQLSYEGISSDDGRYSHPGPVELSVPTPGGQLSFQRSYNGSDTDLHAPLGPGWTHSHQMSVVPTTAGDVLLLRPNGQGTLWHQRHHAPNAERALAYTFHNTDGDRGRLRRYTFEQPSKAPNPNRCAPRRTGYVYDDPTGRTYTFALARDRVTGRRPPDNPKDPIELVLTSVRDTSDNGFDYLYDPDSLTLTQVVAIAAGRPAHHALSFSYEELPVRTSIPDLDDLRVDRLRSVALHYAADGLTRQAPARDCDAPVTSVAPAQILAKVDFTYDGGLPLEGATRTLALLDRPLTTTWSYGYGDFGPPVAVLSSITDPSHRETQIVYGAAPDYALGAPPPSQGIEGDCGDDVRDGEDQPRPAWCSYRRIQCIANRAADLDWEGASYLPQAHITRVLYPSGRQIAVTYDRENDVPADRYNACTGDDRDTVDVCLTELADTAKDRPIRFGVDTRGRTVDLDEAEICWNPTGSQLDRVRVAGADAIERTSEPTDTGRAELTTRRGLPDDLPLYEDRAETVTRKLIERTGDEPGSIEIEPEVWRARPFHERPQRVEQDGVVQRTWTYDEQGRLTLDERPQGDFTRYEDHDERGRPHTIRTATGTTRLDYDDRFDLPTRERLYDGEVLLETTTTTYDALGRFTARTTAGGAQLTREYRHSDHGGLLFHDTITPRVGAPFERTQAFDATHALRRSTNGKDGHQRTRDIDHRGRLSFERDGDLETRFTYDLRGRLEDRHLIADDHHLLYSYDDEGRLDSVRAREADGDPTEVLRQTYDALGRIETLTERGAHAQRMRYDIAGNVASIGAEQDPHDTTRERWRYDGAGQLREHTPPGGGPWTYTYDDAGRRATERRPDGATTRYSYHGRSTQLATRSSEPLGFTDTYEWDAAGRPTQLERALTVGPDALRTHTTWAYPTAWRTLRTDTDGERTRTITRETDGLGQLVHEAQGQLLTDFSYDPIGNLTHFNEPGLPPTVVSYDHRGRPLTLTDPAGVVTRWTHTGLARTEIRHPDDTTTLEVRDALGRQTLVCEAGRASPDASGCPRGSASATRTGYAGDRQTHTDAAGRTTTIDFAVRQRPTTITPPGRNPTHISYTREGQGLRTQATEPIGRRTIDTTDALGRPLTHTVVGADSRGYSVAWDHHDLTLTSPGDDQVQETYDADGRLWRSTRGAQTTNLRYNGFGQLASHRDPSGLTTTFDYDDLGRLRSVLAPGQRQTTWHYRPATHLLDSVVHPDQLVETHRYDPAGRPSVRTLTQGPHHLSTEHYSYDRAGRLSWIWRPELPGAEPPAPNIPCPDAAICLSYAQGRLQSATDPGGRKSTWTYDSAGDLQHLEVGQQALRIQRDEAGRVASVQLASHPPSRFYYDDADRLLRSIDPSDRVTESVWRPDDRVRIRRYGQLSVPQDDDAELRDVTEYEHRYDARARPDRISGPDGTVELGWDTHDRPTTYVRDGELVSERVYDDAGRLQQITLAAIHQPVTAEFGYDDEGRLETLHVDGELRGRWTWNAVGLPIQARLDGVTACWRYHPDRTLAALSWHAADDLDCAEAIPQQARHAWQQGPSDGRGRPAWTEQTADGRRRRDRLRYDESDQLTAWHHVQEGEATFLRYSDSGRRLQRRLQEWTDQEAPLPIEAPAGHIIEHTVYDADSAGHLDAIHHRISHGELVVSTDEAGYVTAFGPEDRQTELPRDSRGRPSSRTIDHQGFVHAHLRARTWRDLTGQLISHTPEGNRVRHFLPPLPGFQLVRDTSGRRWELALLRPDQSPVAVTDAQGEVLTSRLYSPFGQADEESQPRYSYPRYFAGYQPYTVSRNAPTQILDAGHRLYAPEYGRFLGPDPVQLDPTDARTADRFAYAFNDPVRFVDPDGRFPSAATAVRLAEGESDVEAALSASAAQVAQLTADPQASAGVRFLSTNSFASSEKRRIAAGQPRMLGALTRLYHDLVPAPVRLAAGVVYDMTAGPVVEAVKQVWDMGGLAVQALGIATGAYDYEHRTVSKIAQQVDAGVSQGEIVLGAVVNAGLTMAGGAIGKGLGSLIGGGARIARGAGRAALAGGGKVLQGLGRLGRASLKLGARAAPRAAGVVRGVSRSIAKRGRAALDRGRLTAQGARQGAARRYQKLKCRGRGLINGIRARLAATCLAAGTAVLTPSGPQPIETLRIGDRVTTPRGGGPGLELTKSHRIVHLLIQHPEHGQIYATLLRPTQWLRQHGLIEGRAKELTAEDLRFQGPTRLLGTEPAPIPTTGEGRLVTGTYALIRTDVRHLRTTDHNGKAATVITTKDHPFWSEDQQDFVNAGHLRKGERLRTRQGLRTVTALDWAWGNHQVHDIEVDTDHVFYASSAELLVHNVDDFKCPHASEGGFGVNDPPARVKGQWSESDLKQSLLGHPPRGLGKPDLHHADQMPGSGVHEILPGQHRANKALHPNKYNQGVTPEMRDADRKLHWWYRAREEGADQILPGWIYD